jgi:tRNA1Val (adenine37-N6)-methyltransferase
MSEGFQFKHFYVRHDRCAMKVGTDGVLLGALAEGAYEGTSKASENSEKRILDIGTGSALCSLMMAQRYPDAQIIGIEVDEEACSQAEQNVAQSPFRGRITIIHTSLQEYCNDGALFDSIICNPPFFEESLQCPDSQRNAARHATSLPYSILISRCKELLCDDGTLTIILPTSAIKRIEEECALNSLFIVKQLHIKTTERKQPKRTLLYIRQHPEPLVTISHILTEGGERSAWYADITKDFYL